MFTIQKILNRKVIGFDVNPIRLQELREGIDKTNEISKEQLNKTDFLTLTSKKDDLLKADIFIVTVPTPIDKHKNLI